MTWPLLSLVVLIYAAGLLFFARTRRYLGAYVWGTLGLTVIGVSALMLMGWDKAIEGLEARNLALLFSAVGLPMGLVQGSILLIPEETGWTGIGVGIECSILIEGFVLIGLVMFYPRLPLSERAGRTVIGLLATYALNMLRLVVIVMMIMVWGRPIVGLAHAVVGRMIFFLGIVWLFWKLITVPTLRLIKRDIEVAGRAAA